jgi:hypothetical protein
MKSKIPKSAITERQLRRLLKDAAEDPGSPSAWAVDNDITPQAVSAFLRKTQTAGIQIPEALGYFPQVIYLPIGEDPICAPIPSRTPLKKRR